MFFLIRLAISFLRAIYKWLVGLFPAFFARLTAWLTGFLGAVVPALVLAVTQLLSGITRYLMGLAAVFVAVGVFMVVINQLLKMLIFIVPAELVHVGSMFLPSNISACITILIMARIKSLVFFWVARTAEGMAKA